MVLEAARSHRFGCMHSRLVVPVAPVVRWTGRDRGAAPVGGRRWRTPLPPPATWLSPALRHTTPLHSPCLLSLPAEPPAPRICLGPASTCIHLSPRRCW